MNKLHEKILERYSSLYARVNRSIDPTEIKLREEKAKQLMYGDLIASLPKGSKILDLGCGTGFLLYWLSKQPGIIPIGVDASISQIKLAKQFLSDIEIICEDGLNYLKSNPNEFSGIFCLDVLEHVPSEDLCLEWLERSRGAIKPGGFFYCRVPNAANLTGNYSRYMDITHKRVFTSTSILQLLEAADFEDCRIVPVRAAHLSGRVRLGIESILHKIIFRICGLGIERIFTNRVCAVGFRK